MNVVGVILAGGKSSRMGGGDKSLLDLGGRTVLSRVIDRLGAQVDTMVLNAMVMRNVLQNTVCLLYLTLLKVLQGR